MTIEKVMDLLAIHNIPYKLCEYDNEKEYLMHVSQFLNDAKVKSCRIRAIVIKSKNGVKDIEIQFNYVDAEYVFEELRFGGFGYELFDVVEDYLSQEIIGIVISIMSGDVCCIEVVDLKRKRWYADASFDLAEDTVDFKQAMHRIDKKKGLLPKIFKTKKQYEIYDWNTYRCIIK